MGYFPWLCWITRWYDSCDLLIWILWGLWASGIRSPGTAPTWHNVTVPGIIGTRWHSMTPTSPNCNFTNPETSGDNQRKRVNKKNWTWVLLDTVSVLLPSFTPLARRGKMACLAQHQTKHKREFFFALSVVVTKNGCRFDDPKMQSEINLPVECKRPFASRTCQNPKGTPKTTPFRRYCWFPQKTLAW